jgi:deazaflavin-dependent oxidoreductase (nitroreductase family)
MPAPQESPVFREANPVEKIFNRVFGLLVGLGFGLKHNYLLQVRGRKSGRVYSTPVNVLDVAGKLYLVAPRGRTQWVRNAEAVGEITLKKGRFRRSFTLRPIPDAEKPELLKLYLERFATTVQRYFPVPAGSELPAFLKVAANYPVFELLRPAAA